MAYAIRPLDAAVDAGAFRCGRPQFDDYIRRYAAQDQRRRVAQVFVATPRQDERYLAGFFSLSAGSVNFVPLAGRPDRLLLPGTVLHQLAPPGTIGPS